MFGFRKRECPQVQLYGKLPLAKDYLRIGLGESGGLAMRDWLDASYSGAVRDRSGQLAGSMRFVAGEAWGACLQGVIGPSSDAGGHRLFPFTMCVERRRKAVVEDLQNGFAEAGAVWANLAEMRGRADSHADGRSLLAQQRSVEIDLEQLKPAEPTGVDAEVWLEAMWPGRGRDGLEADLDQLLTVDPDGPEPIRLPLVAGCSQRQQVCAWLEMVARLGLIDPRHCPTVFFPSAITPVVSFSDPADAAVVSDEAEIGATAPHAATLFRSPPKPTHSHWLAAADTGESLGVTDLVGGRPTLAAIETPAREGLPPLAASLRSIVSACLRRTGRRD
ncbi:MAG: hypothetical protein ACI8UD_000053 [Planctomycetota bacterium]|jgi:hypothetical protein